MSRVYSHLLRSLHKFFASVWGRERKITVILIKKKKKTEIIQYKLSYFSRCHRPLTFFFLCFFCFCWTKYRVNAVRSFFFFYTNNRLNVSRACLRVKKKSEKNVQGTSVFFFFFNYLTRYNYTVYQSHSPCNTCRHVKGKNYTRNKQLQ